MEVNLCLQTALKSDTLSAQKPASTHILFYPLNTFLTSAVAYTRVVLIFGTLHVAVGCSDGWNWMYAFMFCYLDDTLYHMADDNLEWAAPNAPSCKHEGPHKRQAAVERWIAVSMRTDILQPIDPRFYIDMLTFWSTFDGRLPSLGKYSKKLGRYEDLFCSASKSVSI